MLAGCAVGALGVRDRRRAIGRDPIGAVAVVGVGVASVVAAGVALRRAAGPAGALLGVALGHAATIGWSHHDVRIVRLRAARDRCEGGRPDRGGSSVAFGAAR